MALESLKSSVSIAVWHTMDTLNFNFGLFLSHWWNWQEVEEF